MEKFAMDLFKQPIDFKNLALLTSLLQNFTSQKLLKSTVQKNIEQDMIKIRNKRILDPTNLYFSYNLVRKEQGHFA